MQAERSAFFVSVQKRICFSAFKRQRSWIACLLPQGCPEGLGWSGKNHPRYAPVFFPARPCAKRQSKRPEAYKIRENTSRWDYSFIKLRIMKLQIIRKIGRHATAIFLITGICLLTSKGIVPTGMITLLLLAGGFIGFLFRILVMIFKILILLFIVGLFVA